MYKKIILSALLNIIYFNSVICMNNYEKDFSYGYQVSLLEKPAIATRNLITAVQSGDTKLVNLLLDDGADINAQDGNVHVFFCQTPTGFRPLHLACHLGNIEMVKLLINRGADVNIGAGYIDNFVSQAEVPLYYAIFNTCSKNSKTTKEIVQLLLDNGANTNTKNKQQQQPLHLACYNNLVEVVKLLISRGADIDYQQRSNSYTPLHYAATTCSKATIELLLDLGADKNKKDYRGDIPSQMFILGPPYGSPQEKDLAKRQIFELIDNYVAIPLR